ncbi:MAG: cation transporter [Deltaproteobacteria bacterium]|nr:cation transporter [Deltaproteobacteria bacterium]
MPDSITHTTEAGRRITLVGTLVNIFLIAIKFLAGIFGHSQALIADAVHSISDLFTDVVVLVGLKIGRKAPDESHHFGHARLETMASLVVGLALVATSIYIGYKAILNLYNHTEYHPTVLALAGAGLSIASKEILYHYTVRIGKRIRSTAVVANAWHHRSDALSSVAVLFGVIGAQIKPTWHILDAYATLFVSFFIIKVALDILWRSLQEIVDTAPRPDILDYIRSCALNVDGVIDTHDLRVRSVGGLYLMELHIVVDGTLSVNQGHQIAKAVENCLKEDVGDVERVIVHVDPLHEEKIGGINTKTSPDMERDGDKDVQDLFKPNKNTIRST